MTDWKEEGESMMDLGEVPDDAMILQCGTVVDDDGILGKVDIDEIQQGDI